MKAKTAVTHWKQTRERQKFVSACLNAEDNMPSRKELELDEKTVDEASFAFDQALTSQIIDFDDVEAKLVLAQDCLADPDWRDQAHINTLMGQVHSALPRLFSASSS